MKIKMLMAFVALLLFSAFTADRTITIFMIGDSTMANKPLEGGNQERGWGHVLGGYFSDEEAENEIKKEDTVLAKLAPVIIKGDGATVTAGAKNALSFTSDAAYRDFIRVEVDGKTIDESNYTVESGSIIVTLKEDYVAGFSKGEHTLGIVSESGTATAHFTVNEKTTGTQEPSEDTTGTTQEPSEDTTSTTQEPSKDTTNKTQETSTTDKTTQSSPKTGDSTDLQLYVILMFVSIVGVAGICVKKRFKTH